MLIVITHHAPVIASMQSMVDVSEVVTSHLILLINPNFTSELTIPTLLRDVVRIIDNFPISHDIYYHGCILGVHLLDGLLHLRRLLPPRMQIWAGGAGVAGIRKHPKGVRIISNIGEAVAALKELTVQTKLDKHRE